MNKAQSRRHFIKLAACAGLVLTGCNNNPGNSIFIQPAQSKTSETQHAAPVTPTPANTPSPHKAPSLTHIPSPSRPPDPAPASISNTGSKVIHVHAPSASRWPSSSSKYWKSLDQAVVTDMVNRGVTELTGQSTIEDAWRALLPGYIPSRAGQIAIKINCNSIEAIDDEDEDIESVAEPIYAVIKGLVQAGITESDICVFDAVRGIPDRIYSPIHADFPGVNFYDKYFRSRAGFSSAGAVYFNPPEEIPTPSGIQVTDVLVNARYLINAPLLKKHSLPGVTLGFKHHFGSINLPAQLHEYIGLSGKYFRKDYSVLVDLFKNTHIGPKTILTMADGLFGYTGAGGREPSPWRTFGDQIPNSLFFSKDPVAIDCVLCDFLDAEINIPDQADCYLKLAANAGLGTYERADPWRSTYQSIDYRKINV